MANEKHGEYVAMYWPVDPAYDLIRGHVPEAEARATLAREGCNDPGQGEFAQCWARKLQTAYSRAEGLKNEIRLYDTPGRGKFPVTAILYVRSAIERAEPSR